MVSIVSLNLLPLHDQIKKKARETNDKAARQFCFQRFSPLTSIFKLLARRTKRKEELLIAQLAFAYFADLISNTAMARQGFSRMAVSACFGGPLLSIL